MSGASYPSVKPFSYVLIPSDGTKDVTEMRFTGVTDEAFRRTLERYFRQVLLSDDQMTDMARHLVEKSKENSRSTEVGTGDTAAVNQLSKSQQDEVIRQYLEQSSFEVVPVTMPVRETRFVGTSLYIDDSGVFKDLPLNSRASRIAQRDIRGDAFLLSNHDDPALDDWGRVDCTLENYRDLYEHPPKVTYDASNKAQMAKAAMEREVETKRISDDDVVAASKGRLEGNELFAEGKFAAAVEAYTRAVDLTDGRRDLLPNEYEVTQLRVSALLNRSLCLYRLGKFGDAAKDARTVIYQDECNAKAYYRLANALISSKEFGDAREAVSQLEKFGGAAVDVAAMRASIAEGEREWKAAQKLQFSKLFC